MRFTLKRSKFEQKVSNIPSLFSGRHCHIIYGLIRWLKPEYCVEVGSFHGYMTAWMAQAVKDNDNDGIVITIDNFSLGNDPSVIHNNLVALGLSDIVYILNGDSKTVQWPDRVDFAFVDGDHSKEGCLHDVSKSFELGAKCVVVHDTSSWWGPAEIASVMQRNPSFGMIEVTFDEGLAIFMPVVKDRTIKYTEEKYPTGAVENE